MSLRDHAGSPAVRAALGAVLCGGVAVCWALARAVHVEELPAAHRAPGARGGPPAATRPRAVNVAALVERDPFSPDRAPPERRYRLPGEPDPDAAPPPAPPPRDTLPAVLPELLGTVLIAGGRSFATCRLPGGPPAVVHVGERVGDLTVREIARGRIIFSTAAGRRVVVTASPSTRRADVPPPPP